VFIAGGIGITPFYSIVKARVQGGQSVPAVLVYNGRTDDLPFKAEFEEVSTRHPEFTVHYIIGEPLTAERLINLVQDITISDVYISGPEPMVETVGKELEENGLHKDSLHQDFFPHYNEANY
jgi:ferredoxin-NADP reductase